MSVCGEKTIYSTAMGDVLLEREFNYLIYGILCWLIRKLMTDAYVAKPFKSMSLDSRFGFWVANGSKMIFWQFQLIIFAWNHIGKNYTKNPTTELLV